MIPLSQSIDRTPDGVGVALPCNPALSLPALGLVPRVEALSRARGPAFDKLRAMWRLRLPSASLRADALMRCPKVSAGECEHRAITGALEAYAAVRRPHGRADGGEG